MISENMIKRVRAMADDAIKGVPGADGEDEQVGARADFLAIKARLVYIDEQRITGWRSNAGAVVAEMATMGAYVAELSKYYKPQNENILMGLSMELDSDTNIKRISAPLLTLERWRRMLGELQFGSRYTEYMGIRDKCSDCVDRVRGFLLREEQCSAAGLWRVVMARAHGYVDRLQANPRPSNFPALLTLAAVWLRTAGMLYDEIMVEVDKAPLRAVSAKFISLVIDSSDAPELESDQLDELQAVSLALRTDSFTTEHVYRAEELFKLPPGDMFSLLLKNALECVNRTGASIAEPSVGGSGGDTPPLEKAQQQPAAKRARREASK